MSFPYCQVFLIVFPPQTAGQKASKSESWEKRETESQEKVGNAWTSHGHVWFQLVHTGGLLELLP